MMKSSKPVLSKNEQNKVVQFNRENFVGSKSLASRQKPPAIKSDGKKGIIGTEESLRAVKGMTCTVFPFSKNLIYYGEFSNIVKGDFARPGVRSVMYESKNWIFDLAVDYKGRFVMAEGFGFVRIAEGKKNTFTFEERVHCRSQT